MNFVANTMDKQNKNITVSMLPVGRHRPSHHLPDPHHPGLSYKELPFAQFQTWQQELNTDKHIKKQVDETQADMYVGNYIVRFSGPQVETCHHEGDALQITR